MLHTCPSGCRADASEAAIILLPSNITVFTLDFSGSGLSEGEHVTLGWSEVSMTDGQIRILSIMCIMLYNRNFLWCFLVHAMMQLY